jgi:hypothetical protein
MKNQGIWIIPFEVTEGAFNHSWKQANNYNIYACYDSYAGNASSKMPDEINSLAYCDLQRSFSSPLTFMGSGRSGFYKDTYIKGLGRTPLVHEWQGENFLHSNGTLQASSAIREAALSLYLNKKDSSLINGIIDIRFADIDAYSKGVVERIYSYHNILPPAIDLKYIAQTQKTGNFGRYSNIVWAMRNLGVNLNEKIDFSNYRAVLRDLKKSLQSCMVTEIKTELSSSEQFNVSELWVSLEEKIRLAVTNTAKINCHGVKLVSMDNNFTLDGRFLDLEIPLFTGPCQIVRTFLENSDQTFRISELVESISVYLQLRCFIEELDYWLLSVSARTINPGFKEFSSEVYQSFKLIFHSDCWILDDKKLINTLMDVYRMNGIVNPTKLFERLITTGIKYPGVKFKCSEFGLKAEALSFDLAPIELGRKVKGERILGLLEVDESQYDIDSMIRINDGVMAAEKSKTSAEVFQILSSLEK